MLIVLGKTILPGRHNKRRFDKSRVRHRRNEQIRLSPIRLIDENGEQVGVVPTEKALYMARDKGLDLVEIAPNVRPPVCKITEWSKFKYELSKKQKGQRKKSQKQKEMRFKALIAIGDLTHKLKKVHEFLDEGHKVRLSIQTPRRVQTRKSEELMKDILGRLNEVFEIKMIQETHRDRFYVNSMVQSKGRKKTDKNNGETKDKQNNSKKVQGNKNGKGAAQKKSLGASAKQKKQKSKVSKKGEKTAK